MGGHVEYGLISQIEGHICIFKWAERYANAHFYERYVCMTQMGEREWTSHGGESATQLLEYHATLDEREWTNHNGCCCVQATQSLLSPPL